MVKKAKPKRKSVLMTVMASVPAWMTAGQARREVRTLINHQSNWMSHGPDLQEVDESTVRAAAVTTFAKPPARVPRLGRALFGPSILDQAKRALRRVLVTSPVSSPASIRAADGMRWLERTATAGAPSFCIRVRFNCQLETWEAQMLIGPAGGGAPQFRLVSWNLDTGEIISKI